MSSICPKCGQFNEESAAANAEATEQEEIPRESAYFEPTKAPKKKFLPVIVVILVSVVIACVLFMILIPKPEAKLYKEIVTEYHSSTNKDDTDYQNILEDIEDFNETYSDKKQYVEKINILKDEIEEDIHTYRLSCDDNEFNDIYYVYMEYFPNGKYVDDFKNARREKSREKSIEDLESAKLHIENGEYTAADYYLSAIEENVDADEETKNEAKEIAKSIESKAAIIGVWEKATGVKYGFESDGHMSVSMSSYDASQGTTLDGIEVKSLLSEIDDFGRIVRGGTWKYIGKNDGVHVYSLFYNSSYYYVFSDKNKNKLGIQLQSGLGEMSFLTRE